MLKPIVVILLSLALTGRAEAAGYYSALASGLDKNGNFVIGIM